jgi:hypothetical protein
MFTAVNVRTLTRLRYTVHICLRRTVLPQYKRKVMLSSESVLCSDPMARRYPVCQGCPKPTD